MRLQFGPGFVIESRRRFAPEDIERLRRLLERGVAARPDAKRKNIYEVESDQDVFYILISPSTKHVLLLAKWEREFFAPARQVERVTQAA